MTCRIWKGREVVLGRRLTRYAPMKGESDGTQRVRECEREVFGVAGNSRKTSNGLVNGGGLLARDGVVLSTRRRVTGSALYAAGRDSVAQVRRPASKPRRHPTRQDVVTMSGWRSETQGSQDDSRTTLPCLSASRRLRIGGKRGQPIRTSSSAHSNSVARILNRTPQAQVMT